MNAEPRNTIRMEEPPAPAAKQSGLDGLYADGRLPSRGAWLAAFLLVLLRQRWVLAFLAAAAAFSLLTLFLPGLLKPQPPASAGPPGNNQALSRLAPYLEKAFRLQATGDLYAEAGRQARAHELYARALTACRTHLEQETREPVRLQVQLGMAILREKTGDADGAIAALQSVIAAAKSAPVAGVAHYYLGRLYELSRKDPDSALKHYESAKRFAAASSPLDALALAGELLNDGRGGGLTAYGVAGLTATPASAAALKGEIAAGLRRLGGDAPGASGSGAAPSAAQPNVAAPPPEEADDPLVIVQGE